MILIPGLASSGEVWNASVARWKDRYECHVLTLAGFAGQPRMEEPFLSTVRDAIAAYIKTRKLRKPVVVGHSLGGFLAIWLAATHPTLVGDLVIVDSIPYMAALQNENITPEEAERFASGMRTAIRSQTSAQYREWNRNAPVLRQMVTRDADFQLLLKWADASDPVAVADGMYEMMKTDLRQHVARITSRVLVVGSWEAYGDRPLVEKNYRSQYKANPDVILTLMDKVRHFVMLDDPPSFHREVERFLSK